MMIMEIETVCMFLSEIQLYIDENGITFNFFQDLFKKLFLLKHISLRRFYILPILEAKLLSLYDPKKSILRLSVEIIYVFHRMRPMDLRYN